MNTIGALRFPIEFPEQRMAPRDEYLSHCHETPADPRHRPCYPDRQCRLRTAVESIALRGAQQLIASDGSDRTLERLRKTQAPRVQEERRVAESGSEQTIDRLHRDMTSREARLAENGSEQTVDRLHKDMGRVDLRLADNGSERTVDRLHREMRRPA